MPHDTLATPVNPWTWSAALGFHQGLVLTGPARQLLVSGQTATDAAGRLQHPGDMAAQMAQALDNLAAVLAGAGMELRHLVRLVVHVTDMDAALANWGAVAARLGRAGAVPTMTLVATPRLPDPAALIETEAMAAA